MLPSTGNSNKTEVKPKIIITGIGGMGALAWIAPFALVPLPPTPYLFIFPRVLRVNSPVEKSCKVQCMVALLHYLLGFCNIECKV